VVESGLTSRGLSPADSKMAMNAQRDPTARLRAGLNPLLTSALGISSHSHLNPPSATPLSALSMNSQNAFSGGHTPASAIQPYNPQEWIASPAAASERSHYNQDAQGQLINCLGPQIGNHADVENKYSVPSSSASILSSSKPKANQHVI
jgi:hypothetical protein